MATKISQRKPPAYSAGKAAAPRHARTNVVLDMDLVEKAKAKFKVRTAREAVNAALEEVTRRYDYSGLMALYGAGGIDPDYDPGSTSPPKHLGWNRISEPLTPKQAEAYRRKLAALRGSR